ncbi:MAG: hypothetical protein ACO20P_14355, partial [bacterium]
GCDAVFGLFKGVTFLMIIGFLLQIIYLKMRDFAARHSSKVTLSFDQKYEFSEFSRAIFGDFAII